ncbi:MAG: HAD family hydrolase [Bacteroidales bacterium]|jgi:D-glycero-D-manno-heptose 1,7-bisphosphate phosphatase
MKKAIFLDRDGVINRKGRSYYIFREEEFIFNKGVTEALNYFISKGYLLIIITNQGGIAKGIFNVAQLEKLHRFMLKKLEDSNITITEIFYCPHHPDISDCKCRKPGSLMFEKAIRKYNIDPRSSFMIGDSDIDIIAAEKAGIRGIKLPVNGNIMTEIVAPGKI